MPTDVRVLISHQFLFVHCVLCELLVVVTGVVMSHADPAGEGTRSAGADPGPVPPSVLR